VGSRINPRIKGAPVLGTARWVTISRLIDNEACAVPAQAFVCQATCPRSTFGGVMYILVLDEFGHEAPPKPGSKQSPVFGYGGLIFPAEQFSAFSTHFFDIKIIAFSNVFRAKVDAALADAADHIDMNKILPHRNLEYVKRLVERIDKLNNEELIRDPEVRRIAASYEIKGHEIFSLSYLNKLNFRISEGNDAAKMTKRKYFNFIKWFIEIVDLHEGSFFYYGFHKRHYPQLKQNERIHVTLVKDVVRYANMFAKENNSTVKIIFDKHYTDEVVSKTLPDGTKIPLKTREERARELIISGEYYNNITDPIFSAKSHWSQGVQAADWACTLLGYIWQYRTEGNKKYYDFWKNLDHLILGNVCPTSVFKDKMKTHEGRIFPKQETFGFTAGPAKEAVFLRPYRKTRRPPAGAQF
jgi:hypothetical protein